VAVCSRCETEVVRIFTDGLCGFCQISEARGMQVVGLMPRTHGRPDVVNPLRDTMRAIECMAQHSPKAKPEELVRWARQARQGLPDRNFKHEMNPDSHSKGAFTPQQQADARRAEGEMKSLWDKAQYERTTLRRKPTTEIQKQNYQMVDRWEGRA